MRIGRLNLNRGLVVLPFGGDDLLWSVPQPAVVAGASTHGLDRVHHIGLLREKCVAEFGSPANITGEERHRVRKCDQNLDAGIPILLLGSFDQRLASQVPALLKPLLGFDDLERIGAGGQHLAEQLVRVEGDGRYQIIQLFGRQEVRLGSGRRLWKILWIRLRQRRRIREGKEQDAG